MLPEVHKRKAERLEKTISKLSDAADYETIVEACHTAAVHHIAVLCEIRRRKHLDAHKGLARFLDANGMADLAVLFRDLEGLRTAKYYGGQGDGKSAKEAKRILAEIKEHAR